MEKRVGMYHPKMLGSARPLESDVPKWEAAGWKRKERPLKKRTQKQAEPLAKPDDSAESA